ncbi:MAG: hypothetical protein KGS60_06315 [Verrucomicrobia bacterium]|nr:hypothetical protein [Verrucomicrobiota bacterium]
MDKIKSSLPRTARKRPTRAKNNEHAKFGQPKRTSPLVIIDEAHRLRNPNSQQSPATRKLASLAGFTLYLSATAGQWQTVSEHGADDRR